MQPVKEGKLRFMQKETTLAIFKNTALSLNTLSDWSESYDTTCKIQKFIQGSLEHDQ